jgi:hypothetical protein
MEIVSKSKFIASSAVARVIQFGIELQYFRMGGREICLKVTYVGVEVGPL